MVTSISRSAFYHALAAALAIACGSGDPRGDLADPPPPRILSLSLDVSASLVELGLGPSVVGADRASLSLPELSRAVDLGDPGEFSLELARGLRPELVVGLATDAGARLAQALEADGVPAHLFETRSANDVLEAVHRLGGILRRETRAAALAARMIQEVSAVATLRDGRSRLRVAWVLERDPLVVVGGTGLLHELLELAGAENAFHGPPEERLSVSVDELAARAPEVVLVPPGAPAPQDLPALAGARALVVPPELAALPLLDLPGRVRALHRVLYAR
jgi:iron complex transport system substrate-binding protein